MRHRKSTVKLGRTSSQREALFASLVSNLILAKRIETTLPKAQQSGRNGQNVLCGDKVVGTVTSGSLAPSLGYAIAFAYVDKDFCEIGTKLAIDNGRKLLEAEVVPTPFYKEGTARRKTTA